MNEGMERILKEEAIANEKNKYSKEKKEIF